MISHWVKAKIRNTPAEHRCVRYWKQVSDKQGRSETHQRPTFRGKGPRFHGDRGRAGEYRRNRPGPNSNGLFHRISGLLRERPFRQKCKSRGTILRFAGDNRDRILDRRGLFEIDNIAPYFKSITVETKVSTRDPVDRVVQVARETHRKCPVHTTLARGT